MLILLQGNTGQLCLDRKLSLMHRNNFRRFVDQVEGHAGAGAAPEPAETEPEG